MRKRRTLDQVCPTRGQAAPTPAERMDLTTNPRSTAMQTAPERRHPARAGLRRDQAAPAGHLGQRRLRRHRHHAADRRRDARRGRRRARRRARARRRRRQRQRHAGRGAPLRRRHVDRLRAGAARQGPRARRRRRPRRALPGRRRRGAAVRRRQLRRRAVDLRRACSRPTTAASRARCCACCGPAAGSAWRTGRRRASSAGCSR